MRQPFVLALLASTVVGLGSFAPVRASRVRVVADAQQRRDSVWYHASDVARLAKSGRPQLLEFFHPN